jgi:purine-nucleoside phosphorylase
MTPFADFTATVRQHSPRLALILGSGLGSVPHRFSEIVSIPFAGVPGLVAPSVHGHSGRIVLGLCGGKPILVFRGRLHFYEGHGWETVAGPIRTAADLGVKVLSLTNAAGGIRDDLDPGDLMVLSNHLFLQRRLTVGQVSNLPGIQDRLETWPTVYSNRLINLLQAIETTHGRTLGAGVYAAVTGPCYETPAEIRALRAMGADAVGMSTAFEAETAVTLGMEVAAISCITNKAAGLAAGTLDHAEVLANASRPAERLSEMLELFAPAC